MIVSKCQKTTKKVNHLIDTTDYARTKIKLQLFQTNENHYGIKTPYKRCPFPEKWRGVAEQELVTMSGIEGAMFVHAGGFVAYTLDREAAIMVRSSLYFWLGFLQELKLSNNNRSENPVCL